MSELASGIRNLTGIRIVRASGGLASHALLCYYFGVTGYGVIALAISVLGLTRILDLNTAAALQTFIPMLQRDGAGREARRLANVAFVANGAVCVLGSAVLYFGHDAIARTFENPALGDALIGLALWNLLPIVRGPVDPDVMLGLRWYRTLFVFRILEQTGTIAAAACVWATGGSVSHYFLWLTLFSLPATAVGLERLSAFRRELSGDAERAGMMARFFRHCLPLTLSQCLYRIYANAGAPLVSGLISVSAAGLYKFAVNIAELAVDFLAAIPQAFHAALAGARPEGRAAVATYYRRAVAVTLTLCAPACVALIVGADAIALALGRGKFDGAVPLIQILAFQVFCRTVAHPGTRVLLVYERTTILSVLNAVKVAAEVVITWLLITPLGVAGAAWAHVIAMMPLTATWFILARRTLGSGGGGVARKVATDFATIALFWLGMRLVDGVFGDHPIAWFVVAVAFCVYAVHHLLFATRGTAADKLLREEVLRGVPVVGRLPGSPAEPVTMVTNSNSIGGVERTIELLVRSLVRRGVPCDLIAPATPKIEPWLERMRGAGVGTITRASVRSPWDVSGYWQLFRAIRRTRGLLHFHLNSPDDLFPGMSLAVIAARRPMVATLQLSRDDRPAPWSVKGLRRRFSLPIPNAMLPVADMIRAELIDRYRLDPTRVVTVRNAADIEACDPDPVRGRALRSAFAIPSDATVFLFAGRLTTVKGVDLLLQAATRLRDTGAHILIVGDGPERATLEARAERDALPVHWLGWQEDIHPMLDAADALVLPSHYEGLPLVLLEAMATGTIVVASAVCGTPECVDERNGFLVPRGDADALADALIRVIKLEPEKRRRMGEAAAERARTEFSVERMTRDVLAVYGWFDVTERSVRPARALPPVEECPAHAGNAS